MPPPLPTVEVHRMSQKGEEGVSGRPSRYSYAVHGATLIEKNTPTAGAHPKSCAATPDEQDTFTYPEGYININSHDVTNPSFNIHTSKHIFQNDSFYLSLRVHPRLGFSPNLLHRRNVRRIGILAVVFSSHSIFEFSLILVLPFRIAF